MLPQVTDLIIPEDETVRRALEVIRDNAQGICFAVNGSGQITGVLTDGDIRQALLQNWPLQTSVATIMNRDFVFHFIDDSDEAIQQSLNTKIRHIPLVDRTMRPVDYACIYKLRRIPIAEPVLTGNELSYVTQCIKTNWISSQGAFVRKFEDMLGSLCNTPFSLATSSGTTALHLGLLALKIEPGSEIIVPDLTFAASINAVLHANLTPVIVDIDKETWTIDPEEIRRCIGRKTRGIMPVHLYGHPCKMREILQMARENNLFVIEDCAEALASTYYGNCVGSFGDVACFSFFGNKTITTGEGGAVLFKNESHYHRAKVLRDHGMDPGRRYWHLDVGYNYRLTNIQAAIGVAQLEYLDSIVSKKRRIAQVYSEHLAEIEGIILPGEMEMCKSTFWLYTILLDPSFGAERDEVMRDLGMNGIDSRPLFYPLHEMEIYSSYASCQAYPNSTSVSRRGLSLPSSVSLTEEEIVEICGGIRRLKERIGLKYL